MFAPQLSQNAETARIAAAQAEFNEKKWVWVPDDKEGYLAGWVVREEGDMGQVVMAAVGEGCVDVRLVDPSSRTRPLSEERIRGWRPFSTTLPAHLIPTLSCSQHTSLTGPGDARAQRMLQESISGTRFCRK